MMCENVARHSSSLGDLTLVGTHAYVVGATVGRCRFVATGAMFFTAAASPTPAR